MTEQDLLERPPAGPMEAATWLRQLAEIARRTELPNASKRLGALARWAEGVGQADRELLVEFTVRGEDLADADVVEALTSRTLRERPTAGRVATKHAERTARVLAALAKHPEGIGPTRFAAELGMSRGTLLTVVKPLVRAKRVAQTGTGRGTRYGPVKEGL